MPNIFSTYSWNPFERKIHLTYCVQGYRESRHFYPVQRFNNFRACFTASETQNVMNLKFQILTKHTMTLQFITYRMNIISLKTTLSLYTFPSSIVRTWRVLEILTWKRRHWSLM